MSESGPNFKSVASEQYGDSLFYDVNMVPDDLAGSGWLYMGKVLFFVSALAFAYAEFYWNTVQGPSIGIGTSGYTSVLYERAIALALLGTISVCIGVANTRFGLFRLHVRAGRNAV